ncbi:hypothetical protein J6590_100319 [Homalodisca vitripennis]|nr:hypothetical protein J6590_100319 [Homalodisca vitripennis]
MEQYYRHSDAAAVGNCNKLGSNNTPTGIIFQFVRRMDDKKEVMKQMAMNLAVNEALPPARRRLLAAAKQMKRKKGYKYGAVAKKSFCGKRMEPL